jgi:hypothetical protein
MTPLPYGFRVVGPATEDRRLVDHAAAFAAYAACDERAAVQREAYLSAFQFGDDFRARADTWGRLNVQGFAGACWAAWLWFDIDRPDDLDRGLLDARRLCGYWGERFQVDEDLLLFYSGSKGFHVGVPTALWQPEPSIAFNRVARRFAECIAEQAGVCIDTGVYDRVRIFRAPNSRHPKTGRHKRRLALDELMGLPLDRILHFAGEPLPFDVPSPSNRSEQAAAEWQEAERWVREQAEAKERHRASTNGAPSLNQQTLEFIRNGAGEGDRHRLLFSAAANLAEFGCPSLLAHALLTEAGLDCGLQPSEVRRQIDCGLAHGSTASTSSEQQTGAVECQADAAPLKATPSTPTPPAGAKLYFLDAKSRPCSPADAYMWTWQGANRWLYVDKDPIPTDTAKGGAA